MKRKLAWLLAALMTVSAPGQVLGAEFADESEAAVIVKEPDGIFAEDYTEEKISEEEKPTEDVKLQDLAQEDEEVFLATEAPQEETDEELFYSETEASREVDEVFGDGLEEETEEELVAEGYAYSITYDGTVVIEEYYYDTENVTIPETLAGRTVVGIEDSAFEGKKSLLSVSIPDSVEWIGESAFAHCENLTSVSLPEQLKTIPAEMFYFDKSLTEIRLPEGLACIERSAFGFCTSLREIQLNSGLKTICASAFENCTGLSSVHIPAGVTEIGDSVFSECSNLSEIQVDGENTCYMSEDGILFTKDKKALMYYPPQKPNGEYAIPVGVTEIKMGCFQECNYLEKVIIPEGVTLIGIGAFRGCKNLSQVTLPKSLKRIRVEAFVLCEKLTKITLPNGLETIEASAFSDTGLTEITIPKSVKRLSMETFARTPMTKMTILGTSIEIEGYLNQKVKIYGYTNSTAQNYALQNGNPFISLNPKKLAVVKLNKPSVVSGDHARISWKKIAGADGYMVYKKAGGKWKRLAKVSGATSSYTDKTTKIGGTYQYTVKAFLNTEKGILLGNGDNKGVSITQAYYSKASVKFKVETASTKSLKITWSARSKATGYVIYRKQPGESWKRLKVVGKTTSYTDSSCKSATTYYYTVRAYTKSGSKNIYSPYNKTGLAATTKMLTPKVSAVSKSKRKVTITWSKQSNVSGYIIYQKGKDSAWTRRKVVNAKTSSYTDTALSGEIYYYTVRPYKKASPSKGIPKSILGPCNTKGIKVKVK